MKFSSFLALSLGLTLVGCGSSTEESTPSAHQDEAPGTLQQGDLNALALNEDQDATATLPDAIEAKVAEIRQKLLTKYDVNKDGKLDDAELQAATSAEVKRLKTKYDTNGDGKLSSDELKALKAEVKKHWVAYKTKNPEQAAKLEKQACHAARDLQKFLQTNGVDTSKNKHLNRVLSKCSDK